MKAIILTDKQHQELVDILNDHCDCGPTGYGWKSTELQELIEVVENPHKVVYETKN